MLHRLFDHLPTPVLGTLCVVAALALGVNLVVPDVVPVLDEALLLLVVGGGVRALAERGTQGAFPVGGRRSDVLVGARALARQAEAQHGAGPASLLREALAELEQVDGRLREAERRESRRAQDPWLLRVRVERAEKALQRARPGQEERRRAELRVAQAQLDAGLRGEDDRVHLQARWAELVAEQAALQDALTLGGGDRSRPGDGGRVVLFRQRLADWRAAEREIEGLPRR
jgi:hypothetical protein